MTKILSFGAMNLDYVYGVNHFARAGESLAVNSFETYYGGKGLNQSIAIARAGGIVHHAGVVGKDGMKLIENLQANNVNTEAIRICDTPTGHAIIQCDPNGQNSILYYGGANRCVRRDDIDNVVRLFSARDYIVLQNEINLVGDIMKSAKNMGMKIVFNPSPYDKEIENLPLELADILVLNEVEAEELCGVTDDIKIMEDLRHRYPNGNFLLTKGEKGAVYQEKGSNEILYHGAYNVDAVDTTAAGDTFTGYFVSCLASGKPVSAALQIASKAAAIAVSRTGASPSIPYMAEVLEAGLDIME